MSKINPNYPPQTRYEMLIRKSLMKHGGLFLYQEFSVLKKWKDIRSVVEIKCLKCNFVLHRSLSSHIQSNGCPICVRKATAIKNKQRQALVALKSADARYAVCVETAIKEKRGEYKYPISRPPNWIKQKDKISIVHIKCGTSFLQSFYLHHKCGCPKCGTTMGQNSRSKRTLSTLDTRYKMHVNKAKTIWNNEFEYQQTRPEAWKNYHSIIQMVHVKCGTTFPQNFASHISYTTGCPVCMKSKMERLIDLILISHHLIPIRQHSFPLLLGTKGGSLLFDFWLPDRNLCIEYDGPQHYKWIKGLMTLNDYKQLQTHDKRKDCYCTFMGIKLIRIPYTEANNVEEILRKELKLPITNPRRLLNA